MMLALAMVLGSVGAPIGAQDATPGSTETFSFPKSGEGEGYVRISFVGSKGRVQALAEPLP